MQVIEGLEATALAARGWISSPQRSAGTRSGHRPPAERRQRTDESRVSRAPRGLVDAVCLSLLSFAGKSFGSSLRGCVSYFCLRFLVISATDVVTKSPNSSLR